MLLQITVEVGGADFMLVPRSVGYIKQTGDGLAGPPVIVYNHRRVLPGRMGALLKAQQVGCMFNVIGGCLLFIVCCLGLRGLHVR